MFSIYKTIAKYHYFYFQHDFSKFGNVSATFQQNLPPFNNTSAWFQHGFSKIRTRTELTDYNNIERT